MGARDRRRRAQILAGQAPAYRRIARERDQEIRELILMDKVERVAEQFPGHGDLVAEELAEMVREGRLRI